MKIRLTEEQNKQLFEDGWIDFKFDDNERGDGIYIGGVKEDDAFHVEYIEIYEHGKSRYCFNNTELELLIPKKPSRTYFSDFALCPNCHTFLIYRFECCPKCGQAIDYREE